MKKCKFCGEEHDDTEWKCRECYGVLPSHKKERTNPVVFIVIGLGLLIAVVIVLSTCFNKEDEVSTVVKTEERKQNKFDAYGMSCEFVRKCLKATSTSKFHMLSNECVDYGDNHWIIVGEVDAQNTYGAMLRKRWVAEIKYDGKQYWQLVRPIVIAGE